MPSNHLILCHSLLLLPLIFPSIRVFFNESMAAFFKKHFLVCIGVYLINNTVIVSGGQ